MSTASAQRRLDELRVRPLVAGQGWRLVQLTRREPHLDDPLYVVVDPRWQLRVYGDPAGATLIDIEQWIASISRTNARGSIPPL